MDFMKTKNVLIPLDLLLKIADLLLRLDTSTFNSSIQRDMNFVKGSILVKLQNCNLHEAYSEIISAKDDISRKAAWSNYLKLKNKYNTFFDDFLQGR